MGRKISGDRGQASSVLIIAVPALIAVALLIVTMLGDAFGKRADASVGADAAALAAANSWYSHVETEMTGFTGKGYAQQLIVLKNVLNVNASGLVDKNTWLAKASALASANGAEIVASSVTYSPQNKGLVFYIKTRSLTAAAGTSTRPVSEAYAVVQVTGGLCWYTPGVLGVKDGGTCRNLSQITSLLTPPPPPPPPKKVPGKPQPTPEPQPPFKPDVSFSSFKANVRLVAS